MIFENSRCQPIDGAVNLSPYGLANLTICSVQTGNIITDGFKSFPSGHSSCPSFPSSGFQLLIRRPDRCEQSPSPGWDS